VSVLEVSGLTVEVERSASTVVEDVALTLDSGEILGLVGESGCGKSTVSMALMGFARRGLRIAGGTVTIDGTDVLGLPEKARRSLRGSQIAYVPQDPATALNPSMRLRTQMMETLRTHEVGEPSDRLQIVRDRFAEVGLPTTD